MGMMTGDSIENMQRTLKADINVRNRTGERLPQVATNAVPYSTDVFSEGRTADERVREIIAANDLGAAQPTADHRLASAR
jgi:hypothetical protein